MTCSRWCRLVALLTCTCAAAFFMGCTESTAEVSGTITIEGQAPNLKGFDIGFLGTNGRFVIAAINNDGSYKAVNVPLGEVMVNFMYTPSDSEKAQKKNRLLRPDADGLPPMLKAPTNPRSSNPIPLHLRDGSTSKLTLKVVPGSNNVFDHDVKP